MKIHGSGAKAAAPPAVFSSSSPTSLNFLTENPKEGSKLPREVIAWLQTLGVSRSLRQPRRDLASGVLVAQICAHYWPQLISVHSFVDRTHHETRRRNWTALRKILHKKDDDVARVLFALEDGPEGRGNLPESTRHEEEVVENIINEKGHYADRFLERLYSVLTGRPSPRCTIAGAELPSALISAGNEINDRKGKGGEKPRGGIVGVNASSPSSNPKSNPYCSTSSVHVAIDVVECVVRRVGYKEGWSFPENADLNDPLGYNTTTTSNIHSPEVVNTPYLQHFLGTQQNATEVWGMLLANVSTLATLVQRDVCALTQLFCLFLLNSSHAGGNEKNKEEVMLNRVFVFFAAILTCLADVDPYFAAASLTEGILHCPGMGAYLATMNLAGAHGIALLLTAVVPMHRAKLRQLLPSLLSAVYEVLTSSVSASLRDSTSAGSSEAVGRRQIVLLMCALLDKYGTALSRGEGALGGREPPPNDAIVDDSLNANSSKAETADGGLFWTAPSPLVAYGMVLCGIARHHAACALTAESPTLRLAGAALCARMIPAHLRAEDLLAHLAGVLPFLRGANLPGEDGEARGRLALVVDPAEAAARWVYLAQWAGAVWRAAARAFRPRGAEYGGGEGRRAAAALTRPLRAALTAFLREERAVGGLAVCKAAVALELAGVLARKMRSPAETTPEADPRDYDEDSEDNEEDEEDWAMVDATMAFLTSHELSEACQSLMRPSTAADSANARAVVQLRLPPFGYGVALRGIFEQLPPLLVCEAILRRFEMDPPDEVRKYGASERETSRASSLKRSGASVDSKFASGESSRQRVAWLHRALITGRDENFPLLPFTVQPEHAIENAEIKGEGGTVEGSPTARRHRFDRQLARRWRGVLRASARDLLQAIADERILQKQRANRILRGMLHEAAAEEASEEVTRIFELAGKSHRVIRRWFLDLSPLLTPAYDLRRFTRQGRPDPSTAAPAAEVAQAALLWFQDNFNS